MPRRKVMSEPEATYLATTKPRSIMVLVERMTSFCWWPFATPGSSVFSAAATDPAGYSAPANIEAHGIAHRVSQDRQGRS